MLKSITFGKFREIYFTAAKKSGYDHLYHGISALSGEFPIYSFAGEKAIYSFSISSLTQLTIISAVPFIPSVEEFMAIS